MRLKVEKQQQVHIARLSIREWTLFMASDGAEEESSAQVWIARGGFSHDRPDKAGGLLVEPRWNAHGILDGG
jgi:hypothetical protein